MTKVENTIYDFNKSVFGEEFAVKFFCFCSDAFTALMYAVYLTTLPFRFVELVVENFNKKRSE